MCEESVPILHTCHHTSEIINMSTLSTNCRPPLSKLTIRKGGNNTSTGYENYEMRNCCVVTLSENEK